MYKLTQKKKNIIETEANFEYSRSSGPGGQKVNKTETQVAIRYSIQDTSLFKVEQKQRIEQKLANRMTKQGEILIQTDRHRTRLQNQKLCLQKLYECIELALTYDKVRRKTRPTRGSVEKRIQDKKRQGEKKKNRQKY